MLMKIDEYHPSKIRFGENHRGQTSQNVKSTRKSGFSGKIRRIGSLWSPATLDHGRRGPWAGSPATMEFFSLFWLPFGRRFSAVFQAFLLLFSPVIFLTFLLA